MMVFKGDKKTPEPSTGVIKFPGGNIEVTRTSSGSYWAHISINREDDGYEEGVIEGFAVNSRVAYKYEAGQRHGIKDIPEVDQITQIAIEIGREPMEGDEDGIRR
jgi:hypothetical protein